MEQRYIFNETRPVSGSCPQDILENMRKSEADRPDDEPLRNYAERLMHRVQIQDANFTPVDPTDFQRVVDALVAAKILLPF